MKKNEIQKTDYKLWLKSQIGMLPSHDMGVDVYCPRCHARRLQADFTRRKVYFRCLGCHRTAAGLWEFLAVFNRNLSGLRLTDAKAYIDGQNVSYEGLPDEIVFATDVMLHAQSQELQAREQRRIARRQEAIQADPIAELQRRVLLLEGAAK